MRHRRDNWGKYHLCRQTNDANGATNDAWTRTCGERPHKPEYGIYTWVMRALRSLDTQSSLDGSAWDWAKRWARGGGAIGGRTPSVIEWQVAKRPRSPSTYGRGWTPAWGATMPRIRSTTRPMTGTLPTGPRSVLANSTQFERRDRRAIDPSMATDCSDPSGDATATPNMDLLELVRAEDIAYLYFAFTSMPTSARPTGQVRHLRRHFNDANGATSDA